MSNSCTYLPAFVLVAAWLLQLDVAVATSKPATETWYDSEPSVRVAQPRAAVAADSVADVTRCAHDFVAWPAIKKKFIP